MIKFSIIIPVYNVEEFLPPLLETIKNQKTKFTYEVIFVDDLSTDNSIEIIENYISQNNLSNWQVYKSNIKLGPGGARNRGIEVSTGVYIMHVDSDDSLSINCVEYLLSQAVEKELDFIQSDYTRNIKCLSKNGDKLRSSKKGTFLSYPWAKIIKKSVYENIRFVDVIFFEDTLYSCIINYLPLKCGFIKNKLYYHRINSKSIVQTTKANKKNYKAIDRLWIIPYMVKEIEDNKISIDNKIYCQFLLQFSRSLYPSIKLYDDKEIKDIFIICAVWFMDFDKKYYKNFKLSHTYKAIRKSLLNMDYNLWKKGSSI